MKFAVDLAATNGGEKQTGLGVYAGQIFSALQRKAPQHEWIGITQVTTDLSTPKRVWWDQVRLAHAAQKIQPDVLFVPAFSSPLRYHGKKVMTVHDLNGILLPKIFSHVSRWYWGNLLPRSAKACDAILVPSQVVAEDVMKHLHIPREKIHVTGEGIHPQIHLLEDAQVLVQGLKDMKLDKPFILSVGTLEPRKNYPRLIEAFARAKRGEHELVIVGKQGWDMENIQRMIQKFHLTDKVRLLDYVTTEQLTVLYNSCTAFVLVSQSEGFGLPVVEAMACGAPVIISDRGSLPEIAGEAGIRVNPNDIIDMTDKLNSLFSDELFRIKLQKASLAQSRVYSWDRAAQLTLEVLEHV
ncbi:MAG: glycosyltransferase family 1 protein [Patescibacteria group bacterium]